MTSEDDDLPTARLPASDEPEAELSTIRLPASAIEAIEAIERTVELHVEPEQLDLPTIKLLPRVPPVPIALEPLEPLESTVEMTRDALPLELLQPALPFLEPFLPDTAKRLEVKRIAKIAAEVAAGPRAVVLARHGLTSEGWRALEEEWTSRIAGEVERGDVALRNAYDDAYLEARVAHRGPFDEESLTELRAEIETGLEAHAGIEMDVADAMRFKRAAARRRR